MQGYSFQFRGQTIADVEARSIKAAVAQYRKRFAPTPAGSVTVWSQGKQVAAI